MKVRTPSKSEFDYWFEISTNRQAEDRTIVTGNTFEEELVALKEMIPMILPNGMESENHIFNILLVEEENIGFIWFGSLPDLPPNSIFLFDIIISQDHRGKGYGRKLLTLMQENFKAKGYTKILLNVLNENYAINLYSSLGYKVIQEVDKGCLMELVL